MAVVVVLSSTLDTSINDEWLQITAVIFPSNYCNNHVFSWPSTLLLLSNMREYFSGSSHSFRSYMLQCVVLTVTMTVMVTMVMVSFLHSLLLITSKIVRMTACRNSTTIPFMDNSFHALPFPCEKGQKSRVINTITKYEFTYNNKPS